MKIILSRKGFDSKFGGQPSPILPDGTLLSLPIPSKLDSQPFTDLVYDKKSYFDIIKELNLKNKFKKNYTCHLDPDIRRNSLKRASNWKPLFGQENGALSHLEKNKVQNGDIFLFFGWFKQTELINGKYNYVKGAPDLHIIFGYLQIGEIHKSADSNKDFLKDHCHYNRFSKNSNNCIYESTKQLSLDKKLPGSGCLKFNEELVLTKKGLSRSKWNLPNFFKKINITHHSKSSFKDGYFESAKIGQEFIISENDRVIEWTMKKLIHFDKRSII
jgi:hypothetical protein